MINNQNIKHFDKIVNGNKTLSIIDGSKLEVEISYEDPYFIAFNKRFGIYGFGESEDEAMDDFNNSFIIYFDDIVNTPENSLGQSTLEFKKVLLAFATFDALRTNVRPVNPRIRKPE